ncbi:unnamed protein product [Symbiodinium sp. CCMP2592]|nr:unnamed protein product [Symbiodinium sp. CCMP2592]CAE7508842.1 unnamed protein product [Symbiodinium sp. CCMP2592]
MALVNGNLLEIQSFEYKLKKNNVDAHLVMALVQSMNSQAETLREARGRLEAALACGAASEDLEPLVYQLNFSNDTYKEASKHVRLHLQAPKPKGTSKAKAKAKTPAKK